MARITLPTEIITSDKTPRTAVAFDRTSGVKQTVDTTREVLLVGMSTSLATGYSNSVPYALLREDDAATYFGAGSMLDIACRAAFRANPFVLLHGVGVEEAGTKATSTVTFATTATGNTNHRLRAGGQEIITEIATYDQITAIGDALVTAIAAQHALTPLPFTAANANGVVTLTARNGGVHMNTFALRSAFDASAGTTATLSGSLMGATVAGVGSAAVTTALAACTGQRYHIIADLLGDSTSGASMETHVDSESDGEHGHGEIFVQVVNGTQSTATNQALALNSNRGVLGAINTSETWSVAACAAMSAAMSREEVATRPYNGMQLNGVIAPPVEKRWTRTETRTMINNGVTPLFVKPGENVAIMRAVSMGVKNSGGSYDYSCLDITKYQAFDYLRDAITLMFETNYANARWADSDDDGLLPADVATPEKVTIDLIDVARDAEADGIISNVTALEDEFVVEKVGTSCRFSVPAAIVDGMHEKLGKVVYINRPLA
jgi:phage tail sheath gpL-like